MSSTLVLKYEGHNYFRQRLVMATLAGRVVKIDKIRHQAERPGLEDFEASFLRLLDKISNGSTIDIGYTGTSMIYKPGILTGGKINHDCPSSRGIGYFLEALLVLAPFCKNPLTVRLTGVTSNDLDLSVDTLRTVALPQLLKFGVAEDAQLRIAKRGSAPLGGGEVHFSCPIANGVQPVQLVDEGRIKRIRGIIYSTRVAPEIPNRVVSSARSVLNRFIPDIYLYTDVFKGADAGRSSGYGISLVAESTTGALLSAEMAGSSDQPPEEFGRLAAKQLLKEIDRGGVFDSNTQWMALLMMVLSSEDVSKVRLGKLTEFTIQYLRDLKQMFGVTFKIKPDPATKTVLLTCVGTGYINIGKKRN
ncbi:hypothetical protein H4R33_001447 [Dimargaris cristalligena]|uniref:RNA 3'-terminal phosphate cyclase family protein n=1 Tax=Dimargaris cristalligena TaxID=215637 RepID=A0A4P9ZYU8_9FUNG|nr:hypothetical protein H4R33_001447 [Dimargaris cristalligena]RKP37960.1 RNA 3'-terminal phosphate cyclase family protein [Dimargaris cristalligena]|eukprot:RKP37960.1 RNA 3'-terminal phosphate cyclase family protein [Dimargaris cristalligena]